MQISQTFCHFSLKAGIKTELRYQLEMKNQLFVVIITIIPSKNVQKAK